MCPFRESALLANELGLGESELNDWLGSGP